MSISPRDAIVLGALIPDARTRLLRADDRERIAAQFGMPPVKVDELAARILSSIVDGARLLDECQPRDAKRCPHCCAVIP